MNEPNNELPTPTIAAFELVDARSRVANVDIGLGNGIVVKRFAVVRRWNGTLFLSVPSWRHDDEFIHTVKMPDKLLTAISDLVLGEYERQTAVDPELDQAEGGAK